MKSRFFVATLAICSVASGVMARSAVAGDVAVPFKGQVERACEFVNVEGGSLVPNDRLFPTVLTSVEGNAGRLTLVCNAPAVVKVDGYKPTSETFEVVESKISITGNGQEGDYVKVEPGKTEIGVNLTLVSKQAIAPGGYSYNVILSATP
jgi:type 1 fimbria pilin